MPGKKQRGTTMKGLSFLRAFIQSMECGDASPLSMLKERRHPCLQRLAYPASQTGMSTLLYTATVCFLLLAVAYRADAQVVPNQRLVPPPRPYQPTSVSSEVQAERQAQAQAALRRLEELKTAPRQGVDRETTHYQIVLSGGGDGGSPTLYAINQDTGEVAQWSGWQNKWIPGFNNVLPLDWNDVRTQQEEQIKTRMAWAAEQADRQAKNEALRDGFLKTIPHILLAEMVAMADDISIVYHEQDRYWNKRIKQPGRTLLIGDVSSSNMAPADFPNMKVEEVFIRFETPLKGWVAPSPVIVGGRPVPGAVYTPDTIPGKVIFYLSHTSSDNKTIFPAPETIVEDVKAEIKRQAEEQERQQYEKVAQEHREKYMAMHKTVTETFLAATPEEQIKMAAAVFVLKYGQPLIPQDNNPDNLMPAIMQGPDICFHVVEVLKGPDTSSSSPSPPHLTDAMRPVVGDIAAKELSESFANLSAGDILVYFTVLVENITFRYVFANERLERAKNYPQYTIFPSARETPELVADIKAILAKEKQE